uniref:Holliday junction resolvase n=1 Tax=Marseillevirus LCMAC201 TaxID=2506605 RepID=A0A481YXV5_9VIRU|nr:MAG: holliday junction resolvase [Marseillevirus LCMAC201]
MTIFGVLCGLKDELVSFRMPLYAGFDIGIKNLAFCIIDSKEWRKYRAGESDNPGIKMWVNLNMVGDPETCVGIIKYGKKKGLCCGKQTKWVLDLEYYCGTHKPEYSTVYKSPKIKNLNMRLLKKKTFTELDNIELFNRVAHIAIESQPRINQQMKMFAASIESYFIIRQNIDNPHSMLKAIRASPAKNKLSMYDGPKINTEHIKNPYNRRKYLAQKHTEYFLHRSPEVLDEHYYPSKKRDDLADAFLHCIMAIK